MLKKDAFVYLYPINVESAPNWVMRKAFENSFSKVKEYDWINTYNKKGIEYTQNEFLAIIKEKKPDYAFMQIQHENNMSVDVLSEIAKYTKVINWTGDVRDTEVRYKWFEDVGKHIYLTLFSNEHDVNIMRNRGIRCDYLQIGFDNVWYNKRDAIADYPDIVYCSNCYTEFPLSGYRVKVVNALKEEFSDKFKLFGAGWDKYGIKSVQCNNIEEYTHYNSCKIAISVSNFNYERYFSDRLLRIMGSGGAMALSHKYLDYDKDFEDKKHFVVFRDENELIDKCRYYLQNDKERIDIVENAYKNVHEKHTWDHRCKELIKLMANYD